LPTVFRVGEGLVGQCALEKRRLLLTEVPSNYISISSGLGEAAPLNIMVLPVLFEGDLRAVIELASFERFSDVHVDFLDQLIELIGIVLNTIEASMRTEDLLKQSQFLARELQSQQEELRRTNEELRQNAQLLGDNPERNLTAKQIEFANIIQSSGQELLTLINDILDLSKIESGTVALDLREETFSALRDAMERNFRHLADSKGLAFEVVLEAGLPRRLRTDRKRLAQALRNPASKAFKFTDAGQCVLPARVACRGR